MHETAYLRSNHLLVKVALPGKGLHAKHRFDYTGYIPEIIVDGRDVIGTHEQFDPTRWTSYGAGLCAEFVFPTACDNVDAQGYFPKIGVGLLRSLEGKRVWDIRSAYEVKPGHFDCSIRDSTADFCFTLDAHNGYGASLTRRVTVENCAVVVSSTLTNTGDRAFDRASEYNHNFLAINGRPIGPGYALKLPSIAAWPEMPVKVLRNGETITLSDQLDAPIFFRSDEMKPCAGVTWELTHESERVGIREVVDVVPEALAVWGIAHVISAEVFVPVALSPGESKSWTRRWEIFST